jgi:hypothetical protein
VLWYHPEICIAYSQISKIISTVASCNFLLIGFVASQELKIRPKQQNCDNYMPQNIFKSDFQELKNLYSFFL